MFITSLSISNIISREVSFVQYGHPAVIKHRKFAAVFQLPNMSFLTSYVLMTCLNACFRYVANMKKPEIVQVISAVHVAYVTFLFRFSAICLQMYCAARYGLKCRRPCRYALQTVRFFLCDAHFKLRS